LAGQGRAKKHPPAKCARAKVVTTDERQLID